MYLETIQEETSDDLRSDSDVDSRNSPVGWLATDSEDGSVICMDQLGKILIILCYILIYYVINNYYI